MEIEKAEKVHSIVSEIALLKSYLECMSKHDSIIFLGTRSPSHADDVIPNKEMSWHLRNVLRKHHSNIVQDVRQSINDLEKQIEEL